MRSHGNSQRDEVCEAITRRKMIALTGGVGVSTLAGCAGSDKNNDIEKGDPVDDTFTARMVTVPTDAQYNEYNPRSWGWLPHYILFDVFAKRTEDGDYIPVVFEDWEIDGKTVTAHIDQSRKWHNGDDITADDIVTKYRIELGMERQPADYVKNVEKVDDYTVKLNLKSTTNAEVLKEILFPIRLSTKHSEFGDIADMFNDGEKEAAQSDLTEKQLEEPIGNGPFQYGQADEQRLLLKKFEGYPTANDLNFPNYEFVLTTSEQKFQAMAQKDKVDGTTGGVGQDMLDTWPDHILEIRYPSSAGYSFILNLDHEDLGNRNVRRALNYVCEGEKIRATSNTPSNLNPVKYKIGTAQWDYLSDEMKDQLEPYSYDPDKAATLLKEEGYEKSNGTWMRPSGEPLELIILGTGTLNYESAYLQLLKDFGIKADMESVESTGEQERLQSGDFDMNTDWYGDVSRKHPYFGFFEEFSGTFAKEVLSIPEEVKVPPVGDPNGDLQTVNVRDLIAEYGRTSDEQKSQELFDELAWTWNQFAPKVPFHNGIRQAYMDSRDWKLPSKEEMGNVRFPYFWLPRTGEITAKTE